jgi:chemotaxis protein CheX
MKAAYINPFINAVINLFQTMVGLSLNVGAPELKSDAKPNHDICGVIDVTGEVQGRVVVSMPETMATVLASELLEEHIEQLDEDCIDAVGEIANMIAGNAKTDFPGGGNAISVPQVVIGRGNVTYPAATPVISIPCQTEQGALSIDVALKASA